MEYKDYYKILGVSQTAGQEEIKKAYRRLARKYHPDFNKGNAQAEAKFKEINEAYQVLGDSGKRQKYDQLGANWDKYHHFQGSPFDFETGQRSGGGGFQDFGRGKYAGFSDFFKTFFGGFGGPGGEEFAGGFRSGGIFSRDQDQTVTANLEISLPEAVQGASKRLTLTKEQICEQCGGSGVAGRSECKVCRGSGVVRQPEEVEVKIPAGVQPGSKIRLAGKGRLLPGNRERGPLILIMKIRLHEFFHLRGRNIHCDLPLSLYEAVLGAEVEVPLVNGKVRMRIPPETPAGKIFRLPGKGLPALGKHPAGDQIVKVTLVMPSNLSAREKELFQELSRLRPANPRTR